MATKEKTVRMVGEDINFDKNKTDLSNIRIRRILIVSTLPLYKCTNYLEYALSAHFTAIQETKRHLLAVKTLTNTAALRKYNYVQHFILLRAFC